MSRIVYVNGAYLPEEDAKISVFDRGFIFGDGIYEVSAVIGGKLVDCEAHLARLARSCGEIRLALPWSTAELVAIHEELIRRNALDEGGVYLSRFSVPKGRHADAGDVHPGPQLRERPGGEDRHQGRLDAGSALGPARHQERQSARPSAGQAVRRRKRRAGSLDDRGRRGDRRRLLDRLDRQGQDADLAAALEQGPARHHAQGRAGLYRGDGFRLRGARIHAGRGAGRRGGLHHVSDQPRHAGDDDRRPQHPQRRPGPDRAAPARDLHRG